MKRALAAAAVGLGLGGAGAAVSTDEAERETAEPDRIGEHVHHPELVLAFAHDYHPGVTFQPVDRLPQRAVNDILGYSGDGDEPVVSEPTDYNGYVVVRRPNLPGEYTFVFVNRWTLQEDHRYRFTDDVVFFDARMNLVSASITTGDRADESPVETTTPTDETATTTDETATTTDETATTTDETATTTDETATAINQTTTQEVIVETAETDGDE